MDCYPPRVRDPDGVHGAIWGELTGEEYRMPVHADWTLVSYGAGLQKAAYVEPLAVGDVFAAMPLYLTNEGYIEVPLEATSQAAYEAVPRLYRMALEG